MRVHVLGSAAGGGVPQWNCRCANCEAARRGRAPCRTQDAVAISADGHAWVLFNASTDIRHQIARDPALAPRALRASPIAAVFLTDANIDHAAGLLDFRQSTGLRVYSTARVRAVLVANPAFAPFARSPHAWEPVDDAAMNVAGLSITPVEVAGLEPAFAGGAPAPGAATAYAIEDESGARVTYAPVFLEVGPDLSRAVERADVALLDGSFWTDDELIRLGLGRRTAREMGHAPISGPGGSLAAFADRAGARRIYTHVNNSNPVLDPASPATVQVRSAGFAIAEDAAEFVLDGTRRGSRAGA